MEYIIRNTPCGEIEGIREEKIERFLGIPFATAERFKYPKEVTSWEGRLQAFSYGDAPLQKDAFHQTDYLDTSDFCGHEMLNGVEVKYSEKCLNLNIWAPENAEKAPVLIVIYGGGLVAGRTNELIYDGTAFAKKGIIVVFLSYRVNIFGFLALKAMAERDGKSGNYGYYDQQIGIEWVRHNIASFGGNPENMTLAGQSAGAASCEAQIKSPMNKGYFKQAFIQSSAGFTTVLKAKDNREKEYRKWQKIYDASGCGSLEEFIQLPAEQLFRLFEENGGNSIGFTNVVYDENFSSSLKNQPCDTKIIIGITSEDVMPFILYIMSALLAKNQAKGNVDTYRYLFCRQLPGDDKGAWHTSDLWYFYGNMKKCWRPFTEEDYILSEKMIEYAANFMKTGNPNSAGLTPWLPYSQSKKGFMFFDTVKGGMGKPKVIRLLKEMIFGDNIGMS